MDQLEALCRRRRVRAVYVTPHHQFPTTVSLKPERRLRLLLLAEQFNFAIIEDDYDHEFHFSHRPLMPLASMDRRGKVIYIDSMSKLLSPSLRLGYLVAPARVIESAATYILMIDRQGDPVTERAVAELTQAGEIRRHANKARRVYAQRRKHLAEILTEHFSDELDFILPDGGLAVWARFRKPMNMQKLIAAAETARIRFLVAQEFACDFTSISAIRLGFACFDAEEMNEAGRRFKHALIAARSRRID
jgi:GntR family transcriptional regulator/MocR family aminotransferase